jgi:hypothetical protein
MFTERDKIREGFAPRNSLTENGREPSNPPAMRALAFELLGSFRPWKSALEERRNRINPRVIKRKMSNWRKKRPEHRNYPQPRKEFKDAIVMRR